MAYTTFRGNAALNILSAKHEANISSIKCVRFCIFHWSPSPGRSLLNVASWLSMLFWWCWPCTTLHDFIVVYYEFGKFRVEFSSVFIIFMVIVPSFLHLFLSLSLSLSLSLTLLVSRRRFAYTNDYDEVTPLHQHWTRPSNQLYSTLDLGFGLFSF